MSDLDELVAQAIPDLPQRTNGDHHAGSNGAADQGDPLPYEERTELGYARRLVHVYGDKLRFVPAWGKWLIWDGKRWRHDTTGQAQRWMKDIARCVTEDVNAIEDDKLRQSLNREVKRGESASGVRGALTLASTEPEVAISPEQLDADPFLLNCQNGTLDLRTGQLRPHDPSDLLTKITNAPYHPGTRGKTFDRFLIKIQPDPVMRNFLARLLGHALEGRQVVHILPIFWGQGGNGKGTLIEAVAHTLGDYASSAASGLLTARSFDAHPTEMADLFGQRLAVLHESDKGRQLAEATVKRLTGGDRIKARRMREDFWEFLPSHTFVMLTNHKPIVSGTDDGIWRRLRLVPFSVKIPDDQQDGNLGDRLKHETDAVLAWLVAGHQAWQQGGLQEPEAVQHATNSYRTDSNAIIRFIRDRCLTAHAHRTRSSDLYAAWKQWCAQEGEDPGSNKAFSDALINEGYNKERTSVGMMFHGLGLAADPNTATI